MSLDWSATCDIDFCQHSNLPHGIWGVVKGTKLYRLTFSKDLAQLIACYDPGFRVQRFKVSRGKRLVSGEESPTGVYLLCTTQCGTPLRASLDKEIAALHEDPSSRVLYEGILTSVAPIGRAPGLMNREVAGSSPVRGTTVTQSNGVEA